MKDIQGFEGRYAITRNGEVIDYSKRGVCTHCNTETVGFYLAVSIDGAGYKGVGLRGGKERSEWHRIHRLLAEAYIPNPDNKKTVNHKNGEKLDNDIANLEWATYTENNRHARKLGLNLSPKQKAARELLDATL